MQVRGQAVGRLQGADEGQPMRRGGAAGRTLDQVTFLPKQRLEEGFFFRGKSAVLGVGHTRNTPQTLFSHTD